MRYYLDVFEKSGGPRVSEEDAWEEVRLQTLTVVRNRFICLIDLCV